MMQLNPRSFLDRQLHQVLFFSFVSFPSFDVDLLNSLHEIVVQRILVGVEDTLEGRDLWENLRGDRLLHFNFRGLR